MADPVRNLLQKLTSLGCDPVEAMALVTEAMSTRQGVDVTAEKRRAWDREYRRNRRSNPPDIHPTQVDTPIYVEEKVLTVKVKKVSKKKLIYLPENWRPPDRATPLAAELGLDLADQEARFRDYLGSSGKQYADHDAAFCNFLRNERKFNPVKNQLSEKPLTFHQKTQIHNRSMINARLFPADQNDAQPQRPTLGGPAVQLVSEPSGNCFDA